MSKQISINKDVHKRLLLKKIELDFKKVDEVIALALDYMDGNVKKKES